MTLKNSIKEDMKTPKDALRYLQERFKQFLTDNHIDYIDVDRKSFMVGFPTYEYHGTAFFRVFVLKTKIKVEYRIWDERGINSRTDNGTLLDKNSYDDIDQWMCSGDFQLYKYHPSSRKSNPKKNYRK